MFWSLSLLFKRPPIHGMILTSPCYYTFTTSSQRALEFQFQYACLIVFILNKDSLLFLKSFLQYCCGKIVFLLILGFWASVVITFNWLPALILGMKFPLFSRFLTLAGFLWLVAVICALAALSFFCT